MPDVLYIEPCNFEDFPVGGQLSFARQMVHTFGSRLALVGVSTDETPVGRWIKREFDGRVCDFLSISRWKNSARKPLIPMRMHTYCDLIRHRKQILSIDARAVFICAAEVLLATCKWGWEDVCFYFPGLDSPLRMPRYKWARHFAGTFDRRFLSALQSANLVLAAADQAAITEFAAKADGRMRGKSILSFPSRADTRIFHPADQAAARMALGIPAGVPVFVTVGRLHYRKGWDLLIEAFRLLLARRDDAHLYFVGDGEDRPGIEQKIREHGLLDRVHVTGYCDTERIAAYLNAADVFVLASFFEGWPTAMVEALSTGKAIVSTSVGAAADLIESGKNGYIVDNRDPRSFHEAAVAALSLDARECSLHKARRYALDSLGEDLGRLWAPLRS
jgi:glycosyltransferase involved in cell wall biosynthesis